MHPCFVEHFSKLPDPRIERNKLHELMDIIVIVLTVCAVISGAEGWEYIADFGLNQLDWLRRFVPLKNGVPSHDCIAYVISRLSPKAFQECFISWTQSVTTQTEGELISVDGKTARGSRDRKNNKNPLHMVSAWSASNRLVLGQEATEEKSNEITAIPKLLALLELKSCIVSIDAMGCQRDIAKQIVDQGGDYVLGLKGNQGTLHEAVEDYFTTAQAAGFKHIKYDYVEEVELGHGRLETRRYWIIDDLRTLPKTESWAGLRTIGMVEREYEEAGKQFKEKRLFINSIPPVAKTFAYAARGHWGIENILHWRMDVVLREDASRILKGNAPSIMTSIRHLVLNLFQKEPSKLSLAKKRKMAAWDGDFRGNVLFANNF
ncbi:MAG: ISAs1 family transposase [Methylobacter sp.]